MADSSFEENYIFKKVGVTISRKAFMVQLITRKIFSPFQSQSCLKLNLEIIRYYWNLEHLRYGEGLTKNTLITSHENLAVTGY